MVWLNISLMVLGISIVALGIAFLLRKRKTVWIPSLILTGLSILFIGLGQLPQPAGSWNDLIFTLFGMIFFFAAAVTALVTFLVKKYKKKSVV
jgi:hypothetical protein